MSHEIPEQFEPRDVGGLRAEGEENREGEQLINQCCAELGVNQAVAIQILAWADENLSGRSAKRETQNSSSARLMAAMFKILDYEWQHPGVIPAFAARYVFNEPLLDDRIGNHNPASFAKSIGVSREAVNKEVKAALKFFRLKPRKGMREADACKNMSQARIKQLKPGQETR